MIIAVNANCAMGGRILSRGLGAMLVSLAFEGVLPLDFKPIRKPDGAKNEGERNAAKWLCVALQARYPDLKIILVEDGCYANAPYLRQSTEAGWHFHSQRQTGCAQ